MKGYKVFSPDWKCNDFQYEENNRSKGGLNMNNIFKEIEPMFEEVAKMKLQNEAREALEWISEQLDKVKGDTFFEAHKVDNIAKVKEAINKLI